MVLFAHAAGQQVGARCRYGKCMRCARKRLWIQSCRWERTSSQSKRQNAMALLTSSRLLQLIGHMNFVIVALLLRFRFFRAAREQVGARYEKRKRCDEILGWATRWAAQLLPRPWMAAISCAVTIGHWSLRRLDSCPVGAKPLVGQPVGQLAVPLPSYGCSFKSG